MGTVSDEQVMRDARRIFERIDAFIEGMEYEAEMGFVKEQSGNKGFEIARQRAIKEGIFEAKFEIAKKMKTKGYPLDEIAFMTDLPEQQIEDL